MTQAVNALADLIAEGDDEGHQVVTMPPVGPRQRGALRIREIKDAQ